jgi:NTE family protein
MNRSRFSLPQWFSKMLPAAVRQPRIGLVLGGGGARGFAHVGVIKVLESQGIAADIVVGTSVGSAVGALYAAGHTGYQLQEISLPMERASVSAWAMPNRGFMSGEPLEQFINRMVKQQPIEKFQRTFAAVAADLETGEEVVFRTGDAGQAVRASCAVPGIFQPMEMNGRSYVDGCLVKPVAVSVARAMGADVVIAVNISNVPANNQTESILGVLMQTFDIMSCSINRYELQQADVVISPVTREIDQTNLDDKHWAILEGEKAATAALSEIKARLKSFGAK